MDTQTTRTQRLATQLLGQPVAQWIRARREAGRSWREIAADLDTATGGELVLTHEVLRRWAATATEVAA